MNRNDFQKVTRILKLHKDLLLCPFLLVRLRSLVLILNYLVTVNVLLTSKHQFPSLRNIIFLGIKEDWVR